MGEDARWPSAGRSAPTSRRPDTGFPVADVPAAAEHKPDVALDRPLERLLARARDGCDAQRRLRGLLRANLTVSCGVDLDGVLRHVMDAARDLVCARYAAIGVVQDGQLVRFLYAGLGSEDSARIGHLPEGRGLLGLLTGRPRQLRLRDLADHPAAGGFPEHHPPMRSLLCIPIRARDRVFGILYLTEKQGADGFTAEDEDLIAALVATAGVAIDNAILFAEACHRQEWQAAMTEITAQLLAGADPEQALRQTVRHAVRASQAVGASITVPAGEPGLLRVAVGEGCFLPYEGEICPVEGSVSAVALFERRAVLLTDPGGDPRLRIAGHRLHDVGPTAVAPIAGDRAVTGALIVSKAKERDGSFDLADLDMIVGFAGQVALALEFAETRRDAERLRMLEDRQRIGEDLQRGVIHRLFGAGLSIQAVAARVGDPTVKSMINDRVEEIDDIIRDIRATIFALRGPDAAG